MTTLEWFADFKNLYSYKIGGIFHFVPNHAQLSRILWAESSGSGDTHVVPVCTAAAMVFNWETDNDKSSINRLPTISLRP